MNEHHTPILVLGGTGKTGRRVAERLLARDLPVRIGSRTGEPRFDWEDRSTWAPALDGVGSVYLSYYPDIAVPGAVDTVRAFAELAVRSGARRIVLLSGRGEPEAERAEQAVRATGAELTVLRSTWFMQNFSEDYMLEHVLSGEIRLPGGDVPTPFLDIDDLADVAVAALTDDRHIGRLYELTGPHSLTFDDTAAILSAASGRDGPLRAGDARAARGRAARPRRAGGGRGAADLPVRRGRRRPQRGHDRRRRARRSGASRATSPRTPARRGDRRLDRDPRRDPMSTPLVVLTVATAIASAAAGGVFFAFSTFVMPALRRLPAAQGIAAMQSINVTAVLPPLMLLMFGTALACVALIVVAVVDWSPWLLAGAAVYLVGEIVVTIAYNVPRNNELAAMDPASEDDAARWPAWEREWTAGNHVRTVAGVAAAALLLQATLSRWSGGGGIRTLGTGVTGTTVFETARFSHSRTPPRAVCSVAGVSPGGPRRSRAAAPRTRRRARRPRPPAGG